MQTPNYCCSFWTKSRDQKKSYSFSVFLIHRLLILILNKSQPPSRRTLRFLSSLSIWLVTLDSFPVVWLSSVATPLRATVMETTAGDRLRLWFSPPPRRLHSLFLCPLTVCSPGGEVYMLLSSPDIASFSLSIWVRASIVTQQESLSYDILRQRGWFHWCDRLIIQLMNECKPADTREERGSGM